VLSRLTSTSAFGKQTLLLTAGLMTLGLAGCRGRPEGFERYVPAAEPARGAVTAALDAWREGRPFDEAVGARHDVHVVDKQRKAGQRLARYEILGEVSAENTRGFAVRLTLENPEESQVVRFLVLGTDPVWVFRQEDLEMIAHWMHPMDEPKEEAADPAPASGPSP
jgi:hypothetical protein